MRRLLVVFVAVLLLMPVLASAAPVNGTYLSTDLGGQLLTSRFSVWRPGVTTGLPHVLHLQSWSGTSLGTQYDMTCAIEPVDFITQDLRVGGVGFIIYTSTFNGGTFTFTAGGWPWGDGTGTLGATTLVTTVEYILVSEVSTPIAWVVTGTVYGTFAGGCTLEFLINGGTKVGETPTNTRPSTYPTFVDNTCKTAATSKQYGWWGDANTITFMVHCPVGTEESTWGAIKELYR